MSQDEFHDLEVFAIVCVVIVIVAAAALAAAVGLLVYGWPR